MQPWQSGLPLMLALVSRMTHCGSLADMGALLLWDVDTLLMELTIVSLRYFTTL